MGAATCSNLLGGPYRRALHRRVDLNARVVWRFDTGARIDAAPVRRPASFFFAFELPEPSAAFFFADVFPFFDPDALGSFDGAARARDGVGATPPVGVVIRGDKKRLRARPMVGGAPAVATPTLAVLGFSAAAAAVEGRGCTAGCRCARPWWQGRWRRRARYEGGRKERVRARGSERPK
ncbi:hypothetical protein D1007_57700 [Hordeum vulgare]|nr:hypothetical protein D1007_57700 [Hordeum vulgare]